MLELCLEITGLTLEERDTLLKKIDLIIYHVHKPLAKDLKYTLLKDSPNNISMRSVLRDEKALTLFKLFKELNITHKPDTDYIYEIPCMKLTLEYTREWE